MKLKQKMNMIPTKKDINPYNDLDGQWAEKIFLGKDIEEALAMFRKNGGFSTYNEELGWMGGCAFGYYFHAVIQYCHEELDANSDAMGIISELTELLELRKIMDYNSIANKPQIVDIFTRAAFQLKATIKRLNSVSLQEYYELSWRKQRALDQDKVDYEDCLNSIQKYLSI